MEDLLGFLNFKGLDLDSGKRNIDLKKDFKTAKDLGEEYGFDVALPSLGGLTVNQYAAQNRQSMIPEGQEIIKRRGKEFLVDKDRPTGPSRIAAGIMDFFDPEADRDKLGGMGVVDDKGRYAYDPAGGLTQFDAKDFSKLQLNPSQQRIAGQRYKEEMAGMGSPTDTLDDAMKAYFGYKKESDKESRKGRMVDAFLESAVMRANMPFITNTMKDLSTFKQRQLLDAEKIKQSLPNAVQQRLLTADTGFKQQADAIAGQYLAAVEGAKAGAFPRNVSFSA